MTDFITIQAESVILQGTTHPPLGRHTYFVYDRGNAIHVNTYCQKLKNGMYQCCTHYDRKLCSTYEEYQKLTIGGIERQAYGSWMDGAR